MFLNHSAIQKEPRDLGCSKGDNEKSTSVSEICPSRRIFVCVSIDDYETNKREVHNLEEDEEEEDRELEMVSELVGGKEGSRIEGSQRGLCLQS